MPRSRAFGVELCNAGRLVLTWWGREWGVAVGRRLVLALVCSIVVASPLALAGPAGAAQQPITAFGYSACTMTGQVKYSPKLTAVARPVVVTVAAKLSCPQGTAGILPPYVSGDSAEPKVVTVPLGRLSGRSPSFLGSCQRPHPPSLAATIKWKPSKGKVFATTIQFGAATGTTNPVSHRFRSAAVSGSYRGESVTASPTGTVSSSRCAAKGISHWGFAGSPFDISGCGKNIPTRDAVGQSGDGHFWWIPIPTTVFSGQCHPTGTISVTWASEVPGCPSVPATPLIDGHSSMVLFVYNISNYWAIDMGYNVLTAPCPRGLTIRYSGDSTYLGFTRTI